MHVLVIDDDQLLCTTLSLHLQRDHQVDTALTGLAGLELASSNVYDVVILDISLPDLSGLEVCAQLRHEHPNLPIAVLSGVDDVCTKVRVLQSGADDYIVKPYTLAELKARLQALHRRSTGIKINSLQQLGDLQLHSDDYVAIRQGQRIALRKKEHQLLSILLQFAGRVVTKKMLAHLAWIDEPPPLPNTIEVHIKKLREKIDRPFGSGYIQTVAGFGYKIAIPPLETQ